METIDRFDDPYTVEQAVCSVIGTERLGFTGLSPNESYSLVHLIPTTRLAQERWFLAPIEQGNDEIVERILALTPRVTGIDYGRPVSQTVTETKGSAIEGDLAQIPGWEKDPMHRMQIDAIRLYGAVEQGRLARNDMVAYLSRAVSLNEKIVGPHAKRTMEALRETAKAALDEQKRLIEYVERTTGRALFAVPGTKVPARILHAMERTSVWAPFPADKLSTLYAEEDGRGLVFAQAPEKRAFGLRFSNPDLAQKLASAPDVLMDEERMQWAATLDELPKDRFRRVMLGTPTGLNREQLAALVTIMAQKHAAAEAKARFNGPEELFETVRTAPPEKTAKLGESIARKSGDPAAAQTARKIREQMQPDEEAERLKSLGLASDDISDGWEEVPDGSFVLREFHAPESERSTTVFVLDDPTMRAQETGQLTQVFVAVNRKPDGKCDEILSFGDDLAAAYQYANPEIVETSCTYATRNDFAEALREVGLPVTEPMIDKLIERTDGLSKAASLNEQTGRAAIGKEAKNLREAVEKAVAAKHGQQQLFKDEKRSATLA